MSHSWTPGTLEPLNYMAQLDSYTETGFLILSYIILNFDWKTKKCSWYCCIFLFFCQSSKLCRINFKSPFPCRGPIVPSSSGIQVCKGSKRARGPSVTGVQLWLILNRNAQNPAFWVSEPIVETEATSCIKNISPHYILSALQFFLLSCPISFFIASKAHEVQL